MIENINRLGQLWADFALLMVVQNTIFLTFIFLILYLFRNTAARVRYMICLTGLIKLLIPPFIPLTNQVSPATVAGMFPVNLLSANPAIFVQHHKIMLSTSKVFLNIDALLFLIWMTVTLLYLIVSFSSFRHLSSRLKESVQVHKKDLQSLKTSDHLKVFKSPAISLPVTTGIFSGRIFVPAGWTKWNTEFKQMVLRHEEAHIRRHDNLIQLLQMVVQALYFFHPLVFILNRQMTTLREMACDDQSVAPNLKARMQFSKYLLEIAEAAVMNPYVDDPVSAFIRHKNGLSERIIYQMKGTGMFNLSKTKRGFLIMFLLFLSMLFSLYLSVKDEPVLASYDGHETISISISEMNEILINGNPTSLDNLGNKLSLQIHGEKDQTVVTIEGEDKTNMEQVLNIGKVLRDSGLFRVAYMNTSGFPLNLILPPPGAEKNLDQIDPKNLLHLQLMENGDVFFKGEKKILPDVKAIVSKKLAENEFTIVVIEAQARAAFADFHDLLNQAKEAGAMRLVVQAL